MIKAIKLLIWTYLVLLLTEGALRKWVFPGQADVLLVIRDPVVILIYGLALGSGVFPSNRWMVAIAGLAGATILASFLAGQTNLTVLAYGLRINYVHLPLIWVMAAVLDRRDIKRVGCFILLFAVVTAYVMVQQFRSPMNSWINRGVGGSEIGQIFGADGRVRPPGLFAFITGPQLFLPLATALFLHEISGPGRRTLPWIVLIAIGAAIAISLPVSISRTAVLASGLVAVTFVIAQIFASRSAGAILKPAAALGALLLVLSFFPAFKEGRDVFLIRWETAAIANEGDGWENVSERTFGGIFNPFESLARAPLFGRGVGVGSNVGARILSGEVGFMLAEDEWSKIILELGPILGLAFIGFRVGLTVYLGVVGLVALKRDRDPLAILLFTAVGAAVFQFQWGPPTILGFAVFGSGLVLAAAKPPPETETESTTEPKPLELESTPPPPPPSLHRPPSTPKVLAA